MSELGQHLRQKREERQLTIEDIQEKTKIRSRYLQAIENGEYSVLPGQFYARAFIKSYAEAIGLDGEEVLATFRSEIPQPAPSAVETVAPPPKRVKPATSGGRWIGKSVSFIVFLSFIVLVAFLIWYAFSEYWEAENTPQSPSVNGIIGDGDIQNSNSNSVQDEGQTDGNERHNHASNTDDGEEHNDDRMEEVQPQEHIDSYIIDGETIVEVSHAEHVFIRTGNEEHGEIWLELSDRTSDVAQTIDTLMIQVGDELEWEITAYERVRLRFGNVLGAVLWVNDEPVELPEVQGPHNVWIEHVVEELD